MVRNRVSSRADRARTTPRLRHQPCMTTIRPARRTGRDGTATTAMATAATHQR
jgi:hypothetical protein